MQHAFRMYSPLLSPFPLMPDMDVSNSAPILLAQLPGGQGGGGKPSAILRKRAGERRRSRMLKLKKVRRSLESRIKGSEREKVRTIFDIEEARNALRFSSVQRSHLFSD